MNPNATEPTRVMPGGYSLCESDSLLRYLCGTQAGGNAFSPEATEARADVERWMDWTLASMNDPMRIIFWTFVRTPEPERDLAAAARARDAAERLWRIAEAQLEGRPHIAGAFSIADMALGGFLHRWFALPIARAELPALRRWYDRLRERHPGFRTHVALELS